jgi:hypothetical protein
MSEFLNTDNAHLADKLDAIAQETNGVSESIEYYHAARQVNDPVRNPEANRVRVNYCTRVTGSNQQLLTFPKGSILYITFAAADTLTTAPNNCYFSIRANSVSGERLFISQTQAATAVRISLLNAVAMLVPLVVEPVGDEDGSVWLHVESGFVSNVNIHIVGYLETIT